MWENLWSKPLRPAADVLAGLAALQPLAAERIPAKYRALGCRPTSEEADARRRRDAPAASWPDALRAAIHLHQMRKQQKDRSRRNDVFFMNNWEPTVSCPLQARLKFAKHFEVLN